MSEEKTLEMHSLRDLEVLTQCANIESLMQTVNSFFAENHYKKYLVLQCMATYGEKELSILRRNQAKLPSQNKWAIMRYHLC